MAKRKSLNKRSSIYSRGSRSSVGSIPLLDPDTQLIEDEQSFWWRNLEDRTIARQSTQFNRTDQTRRRLSSDSSDASSDDDDWWRALDKTDGPKTSKVVTDTGGTVANIAPRFVVESSSESEEDARVKKKNIPFRAAAKQSHGTSAFSNILNASQTFAMSKLDKGSLKENALQNSKTERPSIGGRRELNRSNDSKTSESSTTDRILKAKPRILKKKENDESHFDNVLKEDEVDNASDRTRLNGSTSKMPRRSIIQGSNIVPESPVTYNSRPSRFTLSFDEAEDNTSHFPAPRAQSTIIEDEASRNANNIAGNKQKFKLQFRKSNRQSNVEKELENGEANNNDTSEDTSDSGRRVKNVPKPKSGFLRNAGKNTKENPFENILEESDDSTTDATAITDSPSEKVARTENDEVPTRRSRSQNTNTADSNNLNPMVSSRTSSSPNTISAAKSRKSREQSVPEKRSKNANASERGSNKLISDSSDQEDEPLLRRKTRSGLDEPSQKKDETERTRRSKRLGKSQIEAAPLDSDERDRSILKSRSNKSNKSQKMVPSTLDESHPVNESVANERSMRSTTSKKRLTAVASEDSDEEDKRVSKKLRKTSSRSGRQSVGPLLHESSSESGIFNSQSKRMNSSHEMATRHSIESDERQSISKTRASNKSQEKINKSRKSQKSVSPTLDESHPVNESVANERSMRSTTSKKRLTAVASDGSDEEDRRVPTRQRSSLTRSCKPAIRSLQDNFLSDKEANALQRRRKNSSSEKAVAEHGSDKKRQSTSESPINTSRKSQKIDSPILDKSNSINESVTNEQSKRSVTSEKQSTVVDSGSSDEENERISKKLTDNLSKSRKKLTASTLDRSDKNQENRSFNQRQSAGEPSNKSKEDHIENSNKENDDSGQQFASTFGSLRKSTNKPPVQSTAEKDTTVRSRKSVANVPKGQLNIDKFFRTDQVTPIACTSELFSDPAVVEKMKTEMNKIKAIEMEKMNIIKKLNEQKLPVQQKIRNQVRKILHPNKKPKKPVDKAYLVNGVVYKPPRLPRPQPWVTDRLYRHLWKCLEPKFDLETRVRSEQFVKRLSDVMTLVRKSKKYSSYKAELMSLMKEMARLGIIDTPNDFYHFCYDFLPYGLRSKTTPILLAGNVTTIPYDREAVHRSLLSP